MTIQIKGIGLIIIFITLNISGFIFIVKLFIDSSMPYYISKIPGYLWRLTGAIVLFKTKKLRYSLADIISWVFNKHKIRSYFKNFYVFGRLSYMNDRKPIEFYHLKKLAKYSLKL